MDTVKKIFFLAFNVEENNNESLIRILILLAIGYVACLIVGVVLGWIPLIGWLFKLVGGLCGLYITVTLVLAVLVFLGILKV